MFKYFEVGGAIRDELMGLKSKDIDYVAVPDPMLLAAKMDIGQIFALLTQQLVKEGYHIWLSTPECFTIRAKFPDNHKNKGMTADFVLARKEEGYIPGTRRPILVPGTLHDDLERRDFTINAIARAEDGTLIDPFSGQDDIKASLLITPLPVEQTFDDDPLRILRAIRFAITKKFRLCSRIQAAIWQYDYEGKMSVVSEERIREELHKCFKADTLNTLKILDAYPALTNYIFKRTKLWLKPTNES